MPDPLPYPNRRTIGYLLATCVISLATLAVPTAADDALPSEAILFAVRQPGRGGHWYENFGYYAHDPSQKLTGSQGRLCRLDLGNGRLDVLLDDPAGAVRDPQVHYSGETVLFSYRPGGQEHFHLFEMDLASGKLRQLTSGPCDDIEPTWLPGGGIMFCSSRCNRWVPCWYSPVATLHVCDGDGGNVRPISGNVEHDNTPWPLPDGRVIYERWEYVDRSRVSFHHLWTSNPDGSGQMVFYGNQHPGTLMIDAKPVPDSDEVVAAFSPEHGRREHEGFVTLVTPRRGPDDLGSAQRLSKTADFRDPYPLSTELFLVARGPALLTIDRQGRTRERYRLPAEWVEAGAECHEPRPLTARAEEPRIPPRVEPTQATGRLLLMDVYHGRAMQGVQRGEIKKLLVLETLPKPVNDSGKMPPISFGGTYMLERILGTVDVEPDGSAWFEVPALRPLFFVALDERGDSVKRMHSFLSVMPGETTGCTGCHEQRTQSARFTSPEAGGIAVSAAASPQAGQAATAQALHRPPQQIEPLADVPEVFDFPRDIQPILDRHCTACHNCDRRDGGIVLAGDRGPIYSHSYYTLTALGFVSDGRDRLRTNLPPRSVGTSASPLMQMLDGSHYAARLTPHEQDMIRYWIESAAVYPGTYAALGTGMIGGYPKSQLDTSDQKWPVSSAAAEAITRRCQGCHDRTRPLPKYLSDDLGLVLSNPDFSDVRIRYSRHLLFNLSRPDRSLILLAPLAPAAGGLGLCASAGAEGDRDPGKSVSASTGTSSKPATAAGDGRPVFADTGDEDYQRILALCREGQRHLESIGRFDMPGFRPSAMYVREMQRYGILPADMATGEAFDFTTADQQYWRTHWWPPCPAPYPPAGPTTDQ